jgi:hypothetical protein
MITSAIDMPLCLFGFGVYYGGRTTTNHGVFTSRLFKLHTRTFFYFLQGTTLDLRYERKMTGEGGGVHKRVARFFYALSDRAYTGVGMWRNFCGETVSSFVCAALCTE